MKKHLITLKNIKESTIILLFILNNISNLKIKIHPLVGVDFNLVYTPEKILPLKEKDYKSINKNKFINFLKDPEEWMSYDRIKLYSGGKLVLDAIMHDSLMGIYDELLYKKINDFIKCNKSC